MHNDTSASPQPRIDIVTDHASNPVGGFLRRNLETVLDGFVDVANYYLDTPTPEGPSGDVVMVMTREKAVQIRQAVADPKRIVIVNRTIPRNLIYRILSIPLGTRVLVVNDSTETTLDFISLLYRLGVDHLDLVPFDPRIDYPDVSIAITPGELIFVPAHIENVIDTGNRSIDISTFIQVLDMVNVSDPEVHRRLLRYSANLVPLESGVDNQYRQLYLRNLEMDSILNVSHEGILLIDPSGSVAICNKALLSMLELRSSPLGKPVGALADEPLASLLARERFDDELVQYRNHSFLVTATVIEQFGKPSGTYFNFRDVTYIRRLEQNLNRRMLASGFLPQYRFDDIQTVSPAMNDCVALARKYAGSDLPVSISGESGTGKELLAHAIHRASRRHNQPFVAFNCAAMPESLLESELFGYETGAFTGALKGGKAGLFEQADTGTIFLDEIGDMPYSLQAKLLRVLQEQQVMRIGSQRIISIDVRVISATNQDLETRIADGLFRGDLYYRLNVLPLAVPPLRNRPEDILHLLSRFLEEAAPGKHTISEEASRALTDYPWPGNIRELRNAASYISFAADGPVGLAQLPPYLHRARADCTELERTLSSRGSLELARAVLDALQRHHRVAPEASGLGRAALARELGSRGLSASEGMIRGVLSLLNERGLVDSSSGRGGTRITETGSLCMNWLINRHSK